MTDWAEEKARQIADRWVGLEEGGRYYAEMQSDILRLIQEVEARTDKRARVECAEIAYEEESQCLRRAYDLMAAEWQGGASAARAVAQAIRSTIKEASA